MTVATWKIQKIVRDSQFPWNDNYEQQDFWSPEYDVQKERAYHDKLWNDGGTTTTTLPNFEHLRKGHSLTFYIPTGNNLNGYVLTNTTSGVGNGDYKGTALDLTGVFAGKIGNDSDNSGAAHWQCATTTKCVKRSPVGTRTQAMLR